MREKRGIIDCRLCWNVLISWQWSTACSAWEWVLYTDLVDILAVSRLIKGTIYSEKTKSINPWGVRRPPQAPLNDAPGCTVFCPMGRFSFSIYTILSALVPAPWVVNNPSVSLVSSSQLSSISFGLPLLFFFSITVLTKEPCCNTCPNQPPLLSSP